jgi:hypothetical protein
LAEPEPDNLTVAQAFNKVVVVVVAPADLLTTAELVVHQILPDRLLHVVAAAAAELAIIPPALVAVAVAANRGG